MKRTTPSAFILCLLNSTSGQLSYNFDARIRLMFFPPQKYLGPVRLTPRHLNSCWLWPLFGLPCRHSGCHAGNRFSLFFSRELSSCCACLGLSACCSVWLVLLSSSNRCLQAVPFPVALSPSQTDRPTLNAHAVCSLGETHSHAHTRRRFVVPGSPTLPRFPRATRSAPTCGRSCTWSSDTCSSPASCSSWTRRRHLRHRRGGLCRCRCRRRRCRRERSFRTLF